MRLHSTVLLTKDLARLRHFYTETLGFGITEDFGACVVLSCGLSLWQPGDSHPVQPREASLGERPQEGHAFELCFEADTEDEFQQLADSLLGSGLPVLHPVREEPWGQRTLRLQDPDGNLLEWGESIPCFVRRLYAATGNAVAVAEKTGVGVERVREILEREG